jgi:glycosyltransferase involved in cell wall biosynthesis
VIRRVRAVADVKVSAIVPYFNDGSVVEEALASMARQTRPVDEIVVVDDGSTDEFSLSVLARLEGNGVTVVRQANGGPGSARNLGVAHTDGAALLFLDSDDTLVEGHIELALSTLAEAPDEVGFVYPDLQFVGNESRLLRMPPYNLYLLLHRNFCGMGGLVDRAVFEDGFAFSADRSIGLEDWDFFLSLGINGIFGVPLHGTPLRYRRWGYSRSDGVSERQSGLAAARRLHPELDRPGRLVEVKREWAPALSVVMPVSTAYVVTDQSCDDFEIVVRQGEGTPRVRGRWVLLLEEQGVDALADATFVERVLRLVNVRSSSTPIVLYPGRVADEGWRVMVAPDGAAPWGLVAEGHFYLDWRTRVRPKATDLAAFRAYLEATAGAADGWTFAPTKAPGAGVPVAAFRAPRPPPEPPQGEVETTASEVERGFRHHEALPLFMPASGPRRLPHAPTPSQDGLAALMARAWSDWLPARAVELVLVVDILGAATLETSSSPIIGLAEASSLEPARLSVGFVWTEPFPGTTSLTWRADDATHPITYRVAAETGADVTEAVLGYLPVDFLPGRVVLREAVARCLGAVRGPRQVTPPQLVDLTPGVYIEPAGDAWPIGPDGAESTGVVRRVEAGSILDT